MQTDLPVVEIVHVVALMVVGTSVFLYLLAVFRWVRRLIANRRRPSSPPP